MEYGNRRTESYPGVATMGEDRGKDGQVVHSALQLQRYEAQQVSGQPRAGALRISEAAAEFGSLVQWHGHLAG